MHIIGVSGGEERERGLEKIFEDIIHSYHGKGNIQPYPEGTQSAKQEEHTKTHGSQPDKN